MASGRPSNGLPLQDLLNEPNQNKQAGGIIDSESPEPARPSIERSGFSFRSLTLDHRRAASPATTNGDAWGPLGLRLLHCPPDPVLDFVFVHGLRGGSVKTWCKNEDRRLYWPQAWLPNDPDLQNVRIHSFGYNSDWGESKETSLDLHDFGRSLLGELVTCPELRKDKKTSIFLIGHSMGGLVMKRAYLLARHDKQYREIANRIRCMFFLATPHRGSDSARLLNNVLRASPFLSQKQYVADIARNLAALAMINDEFRFFGDELHIWSFYETVKTRVGTSLTMIVDRDSAVIGHRRESAHPINADHRGICKFDSPSDPNYISIRNALVKAAQDVLEEVLDQQGNESRRHLSKLQQSLHILHDSEDDLDMRESKKAQGSCEWAPCLPTFTEWRDDDSSPFRCYWLTGQPGAGKSVVAAHIVRHLQKQGADTCYFFFHRGQNSRQTTSGLLRSLAFQMAFIHSPVCEALIKMLDDWALFDKDDERGIWRKMFINGIFRVPITRRQYWVIDGLDECVDHSNLLSFLHTLDSRYQVRILFTSRHLPGLERNLLHLGSRLLQHHMTKDDTLGDIKRLIEDYSDDIPVDQKDKSAFVEKLVDKSGGSFLWVELALRELGNLFTKEEISDLLQQVPLGMTAMYEQILQTMANTGQQQRLIKCIMQWVVCGMRPLHIDELQAAIGLDLKTSIQNLDKAVGELCGQLFFIDHRGFIQLLHATTRDFLLSDHGILEFRLDKADSHRRLAVVCLEYLTSNEMRPPRHSALVGKHIARSPFAYYASTSSFEHLFSASPSDELVRHLDKFFRTNVLSWVEYLLTRDKSLYYMTQASKSIRKHMDAGIKPSPELAKQYDNIKTWQVDLARVALKFGQFLLQDPSCIYFIVPPLCPTQSSIRKHFAQSDKGLQLNGLANEYWDDCVCDINYDQSRGTSIVGGDGIFPIGMRDGTIKIYQQATCQQIASLDHGERVVLMRLDGASHHLVSSGREHLRMWTVNGRLLWEMKYRTLLAAMSFSDADKLLVTVNTLGRVETLDARTGTNIRTKREGV